MVSLIEKVIDILVRALDSNDKKIRIEAASGLLKYYKIIYFYIIQGNYFL